MSGFHHGRDQAQESACEHNEHSEDAVFGAQERQSALMNVLSDFAHAGFSGALFAHPCGLNGHDDQAENGQTWNEIEQ